MNLDPIQLIVTLVLLSLLPLLVVACTSFLKISVVIMLVRNALGVQQIPPNIAIYALSLLLTAYIMAPVGLRMYEGVTENTPVPGIQSIVTNIQQGAEPLRGFLVKNSRPEQKQFFIDTAQRLWPKELTLTLKPTDYIILIPAFLVSELTAAFEIGFLLYLPFIVIDMVVSNVLLAMGMMMVSPMTISLPLKLFLFVMVSGWTKLIHGLVISYL
jgi:type III secretion protein R